MPAEHDHLWVMTVDDKHCINALCRLLTPCYWEYKFKKNPAGFTCCFQIFECLKYFQYNILEVNSSVRGENAVLRPAFSLSHLKSRCRTPCKTVDFMCRTCVRGLLLRHNGHCLGDPLSLAAT